MALLLGVPSDSLKSDEAESAGEGRIFLLFSSGGESAGGVRSGGEFRKGWRWDELGAGFFLTLL